MSTEKNDSFSLKEIIESVKEKRKLKEKEESKKLTNIPFKSKYLTNDSSVLIDILKEDSNMMSLTGTEIFSIIDIVKSLYDYIELKNIINEKESDTDFVNKYSEELKTELNRTVDSIKSSLIKIIAVKDE